MNNRFLQWTIFHIIDMCRAFECALNTYKNCLNNVCGPWFQDRRRGHYTFWDVRGFETGLSVVHRCHTSGETVLALRTYMLAIPNRTEFLDHPDTTAIAATHLETGENR